jgi:excisionase family DNA binding protein
VSARPTLADAAALPATLTLPQAARLLGIGRTHAYALAAHGEFPVPVMRLGRVVRVPTAPLLTLLGLPAPSPTTTPDPGGPVPAPDGDGAREEPPAHREEPPAHREEPS